MEKIDYEKMSDLNKKKNALFNEMNAAERRIAIARDVIKALKSKKIKAQNGSLVTLNKRSYDKAKVPITNQLSDFLPQVSCNVCALGGIFVCSVNRFDKLKFDNAFTPIYDFSLFSDKMDINYDISMKYIHRFFSKKQLAMIEMAFENGTGIYRCFYDSIREDFIALGEAKKAKVTNQDCKKCLEFYSKYKKASDRMIEIMKNIIKNNGEFKP